MVWKNFKQDPYGFWHPILKHLNAWNKIHFFGTGDWINNKWYNTQCKDLQINRGTKWLYFLQFIFPTDHTIPIAQIENLWKQ